MKKLVFVILVLFVSIKTQTYAETMPHTENQNGSKGASVRENGVLCNANKEGLIPLEGNSNFMTTSKSRKMDWDDFFECDEMGGWFIFSDFSSNIGLSKMWTVFMFGMSSEISFDFSDKTQMVDKVNMVDIDNYTRKQTYHDPRFTYSVTPHFVLKCLSIGCGVGFLLSRTATVVSDSYSVSNDVSTTIYVTSAHHLPADNGWSFSFLLTPQAKINIPIGESAISFGVGYDYVPRLKEFSKFNFTLGFLLCVG